MRVRSNLVLVVAMCLGCGSGAAPGTDIPDATPPDVAVSCFTAADCPSLPCRQSDCRDGACVESSVADGTPCGATDPCLIAAHCESGACVGTPRDCDDGNVCTLDTCEAGECLHAPGTDGTACDDGNSCTSPDQCSGTACAGGANLCACTTDADCEGKSHNPCLGTLACLGNACVFRPGTRVVCPPSPEPCVASACAPASGTCVETTLPDGTTCSPEDLCRKDGSCKTGICEGTPACPAGPCTNRACDPQTGDCLPEQPAPDGTPCDDGDPCTGPDLCTGATCTGGKAPCDDGNACTSDSCAPSDGACQHEPLTGSACDDGDPCTGSDHCVLGTCKGGPPPEEACNGKDDDCDGVTDPEGASGCAAFHPDSDEDGWGLPGDGRCLCAPSAPYTASQTGDCDDSDAAVHPGGLEVCNGKDDDCDGNTDPEGTTSCTPFFRDQDGDGWGVPGDSKCLCGPAAPYTASKGGDCDDSAQTVHPEAVETCNGVDDDCDGSTDPDGSAGCEVRFKDADQDGFGADGDSRCLCVPTAPYLAMQDGDCNDVDPHVHPKNKEDCDGIDDDCNGITDPENSLGCAPYMTDPD